MSADDRDATVPQGVNCCLQPSWRRDGTDSGEPLNFADKDTNGQARSAVEFHPVTT